jgi:hypothetical protein
MSTVLDRIPVDRVIAEVEKMQVGRALLTLLVGVFWLLGWLAGQVSRGLKFAFAAVKVGWADARGPAERTRGPAR